jgi:hypothetical protein
LKSSYLDQNHPESSFLKVAKYDPLGLEPTIGENTLDQYIRTLDCGDQNSILRNGQKSRAGTSIENVRNLGASGFSLKHKSKLFSDSSVLKEQLNMLSNSQNAVVGKELKRRTIQNISKTIGEDEFYRVRPSIDPQNLQSDRKELSRANQENFFKTMSHNGGTRKTNTLNASPDKYKIFKPGFTGEYSTIQPLDSVSKNFYTRDDFTQLTLNQGTEGTRSRSPIRVHGLNTFSQNPDYNRKHL